MYSGSDKYGGFIVGNKSSSSNKSNNLNEILETSSAEEIIVTSVPIDEEGNQVEILLSAKINPDAGGLMWIQLDNEENMYNNVISMSQMTSMLRDTDRNRKYKQAIDHAIKKYIKLNNGKPPIVLDIGTGTGLLSMFAIEAGSSKVYACEMLKPLANIAEKITKENIQNNNIQIIPKSSFDITIKDLPIKPNMLISEIFDSILLGEGVLPTIRHAKNNLLDENAMIVPGKAIVYGQIIENEKLKRFHSFDNVEICNGLKFTRSKEAMKCDGNKILLPMHIEEFPTEITYLSEPFKVFQFDFNKLPNIEHSNIVFNNTIHIPIMNDGTIHAIVMWWEIIFDDDETTENSKLTYNSKYGMENWQDHWTQSIYPLAVDIKAKKGNLMEIQAFHNDLNIWFKVEMDRTKFKNQIDQVDHYTIIDHTIETKDICICGSHLLCNAERISMLTDKRRNLLFENAILEILSGMVLEAIQVLDISDGSLLALLAAKKGCLHVTSIESKEFSAMLSRQIFNGNLLEDRIDILESGCKGILIEHLKGNRKVDLLVGEPFYFSMQNLPVWQALNFWYRRTALRGVLNKNVNVLPDHARIYGVAVEFKDLHKCFGPVGNVEGNDHSYLDKIQENWHDKLFPFPLWMYPYKELTDEFELGFLNYTEEVNSFFLTENKTFLVNGKAHAVVIWVEYYLDKNEKHVLSTKDALWSKQMVKFFPEYLNVIPGTHRLQIGSNFIAHEGDINYLFLIVN